MTFNSLEYAAFLPLVVGLYWLAPHRTRLAMLLVASYVFYGWWDWRFLGLIMLSTGVDHVLARAIHRSDDDVHRRRLLWVSLGVNLGILATFKYFAFFTDSATEFFRAIGLDADLPTLEVLLPVGISFYTFQTISYTFDVYRRRMEPARDLLTFAVFVAFFPQLVAGPIERARHLLPQFQTPRSGLTGSQVATGLSLILQGLFKKVVIADGLAPYVNDAFEQAETAGGLALAVGLIGFSLQIYGDFSGYTDIARGSARLLGIELMVNFQQPYLSRNITEFWRTWHISLSTWLRDYLYIPLGGNREGRLATYRNLMITMTLGGLWHGAAAPFVVWGALHGLYLAAHRGMAHPTSRDGDDTLGWRDVLPVAGTFAVVTLTWVFFRARSFDQAIDYLTGLFTWRDGGASADAVALLAVAGAATLLLDLAQRWSGRHAVAVGWPAPAQGLVYGAMVVALMVFSGGTPVPFIYFQF